MYRTVDDFSLEELYEYRGTNPRPADFDHFWQQALVELDTVDPEVELVPAEFQSRAAICHHLYFNGTGGARIHAKLLRPRHANEPGPALLRFHGYWGSSGDWSNHLDYVGEGFTVAALDVRGQGGRSQDPGGTTGWTMHGQFVRGLDDPPEKLFFRHVYLDTVQLARIVMALPEVDPARLGATGGSQGGGLTLACAALEPRISRAAPTFPFLSDFKRTWDVELDKNAYGELRDYFRRFDPHHEREQEIFEKLGYIDVHHLSPRIKAEVFFGISLMDEICPPATQFAAFNNITSPKTADIYPDFAHENLPDHNDRIFNFLSNL
jgi:cephalosporin-C deacetylase